MKRYPLLVFLIIQTLGFSQTIRFQHLTNSNGISQSEVYAFLEDSRGFMWIGTLDGLNRYDGYDSTIFNIDKFNANSISNNTIRCLKEDVIGRIWIGTDNGLCVYDPRSEKISQVKISCITNKTVLQIRAIDINTNYILLGTSSGLLRANINTSKLDEITKNLTFVSFTKNKNINVSDIELCKNGSTWVATTEGIYGIVLQNDKSNPLVIEKITNPAFLSNSSAKIEEDKYNNLWITTHEQGFYRFNPTTKKLDSFSENFPNQTILSDMYSDAETDKNGNLWISTRDKGILLLESAKLNDVNPQFKNIRNNPNDEKSLNSNLIYSLYITKNNVLWVGTIGSGINIYDPQQKKFNRLKIPLINGQTQFSSNFVRSVYSDSQDNIWIGTQNNGLYVLNGKNKNFHKAGFGSQSLFYIYDIGAGNTVICSSNGVSIVRLVSNEPKIIDTYFTEAIFYACKSKDDILWLAGLGGIIKCKIVNGNISTERIYNTNSNPKISLDNCRVLCYDKEKQELFVGTEGGGLNILTLDDKHNVIKVKVCRKHNAINSISNNYIRSIIKDSKGNFWIGTFEGLNKLIYEPKTGEITFKAYTIKEGLPNNVVQSLIEDNQKKIWIGTNGGLSKFDLQNEKFDNYTVSEGLQSNEFSEHTVYKKVDGEIIMGGINGINTFYPEKIRSSTNPPKTTITNFYLFNKKIDISGSSYDTPLTKSITLTDTLYLDSDENSFGFDFSAMLHTTPEKVKYAYMLKGFDEDWHYTDARNRRAYYTNLTHGEYKLLVKSTDVDGKWEQKLRQIFIKIKTPFFYSWFAILVYLLLFIVVIVYLTNYSVIKYTTKNKLFLDNVHKDKMHELGELRNRFFINISHDLRTPLTLISSPLDLVLKNKDLSPDIQYHLKLAKQNVKKLRYITEQLLDFSKAEAGKLSAIKKNQNIISFIKRESSHFAVALQSKGLEFEVNSSKEAIYTFFDSDMISKVLFNILSNAIKHTHEGEITIEIDRIFHSIPLTLNTEKYKSFIRIDIQDSGEGIAQQELNKIFDRFYQAQGEKEKGFGIGLSHCKDLIEAHEGLIEVSSEKGIGTTFSIYIPDLVLNSAEQAKENDPENQENIYEKSINSYATDENALPDAKIMQKILVVEDNVDMRKFICHELKKEYKIIEAEDGLEGLLMAEKFSPDLIISDVMMPNMDGLEFCRKIKSDLKTSHIPIVLLTAKTEEDTKYEGIKIGADDYISKPFEMEYLVLRIKNILKSREQLRKLFQLNHSLNPSSITVSSLDEKFLSQLMKEIEDGLSNPEFTVISLEEKMGMSHSNFYRKIKNITGQSGKDILLDMRMKRAKQILKDTKGIRVSEVAYMVGYTNPKYFSQSFKEYYGTLPSEIEK